MRVILILVVLVVLVLVDCSCYQGKVKSAPSLGLGREFDNTSNQILLNKLYAASIRSGRVVCLL